MYEDWRAQEGLAQSMDNSCGSRKDTWAGVESG